MSLRQGNKIIAGHSQCHFDLFDHKWADHILNDPSWLRADTFSWQDGGVYQAAWNHLNTEYLAAVSAQSSTPYSETIAGTTIYYWLAEDGHKIVTADQENNVVAIYAATGVAWYYIHDGANSRFKLPRTKFGFTGLRNGVGNYVAPGLPNITGWAQLNDDLAFQNSGGAITLSNSYSRDVAGNRSSSQNHNFNLDASRSSSIYGNGATVQPPATQQYLYFYVGNFTQTALENTAGLNAELFNGKVDIGHQVIAFQEPTSANNWTWYRKYADGWVEQGGFGTLPQQGANTAASARFNLPIQMAGQVYTSSWERTTDGGNTADLTQISVYRATTYIDVYFWSISATNGPSTICITVAGMAA